MSNYAIELSKVEKRYGKKEVLKGLDMHVPEGAVYAFLGCNGVGKSTSVKLIVGQLIQDAGTVSVLGLDPRKNQVELRLKTGYVAENQKLFNELKLREFCAFLRSFYPDWNQKTCEELVARFKLPMDGKLGSFSRGMYSKAALLGALCRTPQLLILDDPTLGLDTVARREFMDGILQTIQEFKHTILISSHLIPELEGICDHAGIIGGGKMLMEDEVDAIKQRVQSVVFAAPERLDSLPGEIGRKRTSAEMNVCFQAEKEAVASFLRENKIDAFQFRALSLEDIFIALTESVSV